MLVKTKAMILLRLGSNHRCQSEFHLTTFDPAINFTLLSLGGTISLVGYCIETSVVLPHESREN